MTIEIILIITGIVLLIASVIFTGNEGKGKQKDSYFSEEELNDTRLMLEKMAKESLERVSEKIVVDADDEMSRISNEKIMAVNDFYDTNVKQQLEMNLKQTEENHDHVVFLYNMLNKKEDEIKQTIADADTARIELKNQADSVVKITKQLNQAVKKTGKEGTASTHKKTVEKEPVNKTVTEIQDTSKMFDESGKTAELLLPGRNNNEEILALHRQGKSVLEIAKELSMAQGEVKLVIDLFGR